MKNKHPIKSKSQDTGGTLYRHPASNKVIGNYTPDADGLFNCRYTGLKTTYDDCIFLGAIMPNVSETFICHKDATDAWRKAKKDFDEFERNCNTCKHLVRHPYKGSDLRTGECNPNNAPYPFLIKFHPDDHMNMKCWEARGTGTTL